MRERGEQKERTKERRRLNNKVHERTLRRADYSYRGSRMHARKEKKKNISHIISIQQFNQKVLFPAMNMTTSGLPKGWKPLLGQHTYEHTYKTYVPRGSC